MSLESIGGRMQDAEAFDGVVFLGTAKNAKRDPYRLSLFGAHLEADERPLVILPVQGGTLLVTDRRLLELRAHLEIHGAWSVKQFQGYAVHQAIERRAVREVSHTVRTAEDAVGNRRTEDRLLLTTDQGPAEFLVSKGPDATLSADDFTGFRYAVGGLQPK